MDLLEESFGGLGGEGGGKCVQMPNSFILILHLKHECF